MRKIPLCENNVSIYFILKTLKQKHTGQKQIL